MNTVQRHAAVRRMLWLAISLATWFGVLPVAAHANLMRAEPGIGATVAQAPAVLHLTFSEAPEPRYTEVQVLDTAKTRYDRGPVAPDPGDPDVLTVPLAALPGGVYTVVWQTVSAVDGHNTAGSFAFIVGSGTLPAGAETGQSVAFSTPTPGDLLAKWAAYAGVALLIGGSALWFVVWLPALSAIADPAARGRLADAVARRLLALGMTAALVLFVASVGGAGAQLLKGTRASLAASLAPDSLAVFLLHTRAGSIWLLRLVLALLAVVVLWAAALRSRRARTSAAVRLTLPAYVGIVIGANSLLAMSLLSHAAATALAPALAVAVDWLHLMALALWIGGLPALAATVPLARGAVPLRPIVGAVAGRFSALALGAVGVLTLTGLYASWLHIGAVTDLLATDYGRTLTLKLALFVGLIALGAVNLFWLRPRLAPASAGDDDAGRTVRRFEGVLVGEVLLGAAVLLVAATLSALAPSREVQAAAVSPLAQTMAAGDLALTLTPSTLAPGPITYDVAVRQRGTPVADAAGVFFRFSSRDLGVDETEAVASNRGGGQYAVMGAYTALPGTWQVRVIVRRTARDDVSAIFPLPVGGTLPAPAAASPVPTVAPVTLLLGALAVVLVVALLVGAGMIAKRRIGDAGGAAPVPVADHVAADG